jgi:putative addiction module component (TIGR02574 family)
MSTDADQILQSALQLPPDERAALAGRLLESLDEDAVAQVDSVESAWSAELARRIAEWDRAEVTPVAWWRCGANWPKGLVAATIEFHPAAFAELEEIVDWYAR